MQWVKNTLQLFQWSNINAITIISPRKCHSIQRSVWSVFLLEPNPLFSSKVEWDGEKIILLCHNAMKSILGSSDVILSPLGQKAVDLQVAQYCVIIINILHAFIYFSWNTQTCCYLHAKSRTWVTLVASSPNITHTHLGFADCTAQARS